MKKIELANHLVKKSIEAFVLGIEIYNKPTIKYRIEGFSFFICNAWELMLKAHIINTKGESEIYFKNSNRTKSLDIVIEEVFSNKHGGLRNNLKRIKELRDQSTHFITEDYEYIYAPLFQACVLNYVEKMNDFHNEKISDYLAQNFLTLSTNINHLTENELRLKYSPEMALKIIEEQTKINDSISKFNSDFAIQVETKILITKNKKDADFAVCIDNNSDTKIAKATEMKDVNEMYPLTSKEVQNIVNKKLKAKGILLTKIQKGEICLGVFNNYDFQLFISFYNIKKDNRYSYHFRLANRYGYAQKLCDFICEIIEIDPANFVSNLRKSLKK